MNASAREPVDLLSARCAICHSGDLGAFTAREMTYGFEDVFRYVHCQSCGHVRLVDVIGNWDKYYPAASVAALSPEVSAFGGRSGESGPLPARHISPRGARTRRSEESAAREPGWAATVLPELEPDASILDVGCGAGRLLADLRALGYRRLFGIEVAGPDGARQPDGIVVRQSNIVALREGVGGATGPFPPSFDLIMFHHSFGREADPRAAMAATADLLNEGGRILVRMPLTSSYAFVRYQSQWVQLNAPRFQNLFSETSFRIVCQEIGLDIASVFYDSTAFQFWGSEQNERGIPLYSEQSYGRNPDAFTKKRIAAFTREAARLNHAGRGDQGGFVLRKKGPASISAEAANARNAKKGNVE